MLIILSGIGSRSDRESEMRGDGRNKDEGGGGCRKRIGLTALSRRSSRDPLNDPAIRRTAHFYVPMFTLILGSCSSVLLGQGQGHLVYILFRSNVFNLSVLVLHEQFPFLDFVFKGTNFYGNSLVLDRKYSFTFTGMFLKF